MLKAQNLTIRKNSFAFFYFKKLSKEKRFGLDGQTLIILLLKKMRTDTIKLIAPAQKIAKKMEQPNLMFYSALANCLDYA